MFGISKLITLDNIVGIIIILGFIFTIYQYRQSKKKLRPSMPTVQTINDELGRRILFTIISNNPSGSEISKKLLKVEKIPHKLFHRKNIFYLNFMDNEEFLDGNIHSDKVSVWLLKEQQSFVAKLNDNQLTEAGDFKLTFYTLDGNCSYTISGYFGLLSTLVNPL
jgi:hypothetical protein